MTKKFIYSSFIVVLILIGLYLGQKSKPEKMLELPDYSGIQVHQVIKKDIVIGEGPMATAQATVRIHYSSWVYDPKKPENKGQLLAHFNDLENPVTVHLGQGEVIQGLEFGILGMRANGKREIIIPSKNTATDPILLMQVSLMTVGASSNSDEAH